MKLDTIRLHNFGSYASAEIDLREISAAVIAGPNGAGKSTGLVDAPLWALFGKCRTATDQMLRLGADEMSVAVTFALNGAQYRVIRKRSLKTKAGKSDLELQAWQDRVMVGDCMVPEGWQPVSGARLADTQDKICALLNADYDLLTATGFLLQGQADKFSRATPAERKAILAQILRLDQYAALKTAASRAGTVLDTKVADKQAALSALEGTEAVLESVRREAASIDERRRRIGEEVAALEQEQAARLAAQARDQAELESLALIPEQMEKAKARRADLQAKERTLLERRDRLDKILANRATIEAKVEEEARTKRRVEEVLAEERTRQAEIDTLHADLSACLEQWARGATLERERDRIQRDMQDAVRRYQDETEGMRRVVESLQRGIDQAVSAYEQETERQRLAVVADERAVQLLGQVPCDGPLQQRCQFTVQAVQARDRLITLQPALAARLSDPDAIARSVAATDVTSCEQMRAACEARATDQGAILVLTAPTLESALQTAEREVAAWQAEGWAKKAGQLRTALDEARATLTALQADRDRLTASLPALQRFTVLLPELQAADRDLDQLRQDLFTVTGDLAEVQGTIEEGRGRLEECQMLTARVATIAQDLSAAEQARQAQQANDQALALRAGELVARIQQAEQDLVRAGELRKELEVLARDLRQYERLTEAYAVIPVLILETSIPLLEEETNRILGRISTSGLRVSLETQKALKSRDGLAETLEIRVRDVYGERLLENYSGGERARVDLAIRVGLSRLLANRAGARLETLVVDEAFAAVDREGVEQLVECLPLLSQEFSRVLFITHDEAFKSSVAQHILVHKHGTGSTVEVVT